METTGTIHQFHRLNLRSQQCSMGKMLPMLVSAAWERCYKLCTSQNGGFNSMVPFLDTAEKKTSFNGQRLLLYEGITKIRLFCLKIILALFYFK